MNSLKMWGSILSLMVAFAACGEYDDDDGEHEGGSTTDEACVSGKRWTGGHEESPNMLPGSDCIGCHRREREGPIFGAAGTVYENYTEADDCYGVDGITVAITDADGKVHTTTTRASGNFYVNADIATPYTATIVGADGTERKMVAAQTVTDCNTCHTPDGLNDAPGRVIVP